MHPAHLTSQMSVMVQEPYKHHVQPVLYTDRLVLRPFQIDDAPQVQRLAGDEAVADTALNIPHPFEDKLAEAWIATHEVGFLSGALAIFAVTIAHSGDLVGAAGLTIDREHTRGELGYWIGREYWRRGYATEASRVLVDFGLDRLGLHRIHANHLVRNPASGRVLEKLGMRPEGVLRGHVRHRGRIEDLALYGLLASDR